VTLSHRKRCIPVAFVPQAVVHLEEIRVLPFPPPPQESGDCVWRAVLLDLLVVGLLWRRRAPFFFVFEEGAGGGGVVGLGYSRFCAWYLLPGGVACVPLFSYGTETDLPDRDPTPFLLFLATSLPHSPISHADLNRRMSPLTLLGPNRLPIECWIARRVTRHSSLRRFFESGVATPIFSSGGAGIVLFLRSEDSAPGISLSLVAESGVFCPVEALVRVLPLGGLT